MNIIALSLGLVPVPPLPPAVRERQNRIADERHRCANTGRLTRQSATGYRAKMLQLLRDTGPGTTADIANAFDTTCKGVRPHLHILEQAGEVRFDVSYHGSRRDYLWHAVETDKS